MDQKRVEEAVARLRDKWERYGEELDALEALVAEKATPGAIAKRLVMQFGSEWQAKYREKYVHVFVKEITQMKRLLGSLTEAQIRRRITKYLETSDHFYVQSRHSFGVFVSMINRISDGWEGTDDFELRPVGCQHDPPCRSDQEHTSRRREAVRR